MKKIVSYVVVAAIILLAALVSCEKDNKRPNDDKCICMLVNNNGEYIGGDTISNEMFEALIFRLYPNPTHEVVYLIFRTSGLQNVTITDERGKVLFNQSFDVETIAIDVRSYSAGEYRVTVDNGKQKSTLCFIKN